MSDTLAEMKPSIGKRVYAVILESLVVVPAVVKEKVIRETVDGIVTSYLLDFGIAGKDNVPSESLRGHVVVASPAAAYEVLRNHISVTVTQWQQQQDKTAQNNVQAAVANALKRFGPTPSEREAQSETAGDDVGLDELVRLATIDHLEDRTGDTQDAQVKHRPEPFRPTNEASAAGPKSTKQEKTLKDDRS